MFGDRSDACCAAMHAFTRSRGDLFQDPPPEADSASTATPRSEPGAPLTIGAMPVSYCPWCGAPVAGKREETPAMAAQSARAPLTPRSFRHVVSAEAQPIQFPALRPDRLGSAADKITALGGSENAWVMEVREKVADARGLRSHIEDRYKSTALFEGRWYSEADMLRDGRPIDGAVPSPDSEDRTPYLRRDTNDGLIDRIIFGVFFALGLLATIRFILTH